MKIIVLSKPSFNDSMEKHGINDNTVDSMKGYCFISINNTHGFWSQSYFKENHSNVLILHFDDVEKDGEIAPMSEGYEDTKCFNLEHAKQIVDFIEFNKDVPFCIIHCTAGISRSGAVGLFINDEYGDDTYEKFKFYNPNVLPNPQVLKILHEYKRSL